jgi:hypothetical protein
MTVHEGEFIHPNQVIQGVEESLDEFRRVNSKVCAQMEDNIDEEQTIWKRPLSRVQKVNWNVTLDVMPQPI